MARHISKPMLVTAAWHSLGYPHFTYSFYLPIAITQTVSRSPEYSHPCHMLFSVLGLSESAGQAVPSVLPCHHSRSGASPPPWLQESVLDRWRKTSSMNFFLFCFASSKFYSRQLQIIQGDVHIWPQSPLPSPQTAVGHTFNTPKTSICVLFLYPLWNRQSQNAFGNCNLNHLK